MPKPIKAGDEPGRGKAALSRLDANQRLDFFLMKGFIMTFNVQKSETKITYTNDLPSSSGVGHVIRDLISLDKVSWLISRVPGPLTKIDKIHLLRDLNPGLGLKDAKDIIELSDSEKKTSKPIYIKTNPVESAVIESIGYDNDSQLLIVVFKNGIGYTYSNVPSLVWYEFRGASSLGKYFNDRIKDQYGNYGQTSENLLQK